MVESEAHHEALISDAQWPREKTGILFWGQSFPQKVEQRAPLGNWGHDSSICISRIEPFWSVTGPIVANPRTMKTCTLAAETGIGDSAPQVCLQNRQTSCRSSRQSSFWESPKRKAPERFNRVARSETGARTRQQTWSPFPRSIGVLRLLLVLGQGGCV